MKVTAVLPAYKAATTVERTVAAIPRSAVDEVILVDDASPDETVAVAERIPNLIVMRHPVNRGYGGNQKTCYTTALERGADVVVMIHPDLQYDPALAAEMTRPIVEGACDMVMGSRFLHADPRRSGMPSWRYYGNRALTSCQNLCLGTRLSEAHSGYRAYSRALLQSVPFHQFSDDFVFDAQMVAAVARCRLRIGEVAIPTRYDTESSSISFRRSVRYGLGTLLTLL